MDRHPAIRTEWELSGHFWAEGHQPPVPEPRVASSENFLRRCARRLHGRLNATGDDLDQCINDLRPPIRVRSGRPGDARLLLPLPSPSPPPPLPPRRSVGDDVVGRRISVVDGDDEDVDDDEEVAVASVVIVDDDDDDDDVDNTTVTSTPPPPPPLPPRRSIERRDDDGETEMSETVEYREVSTGRRVDLDSSPTTAVCRV